jgi:hypothetical protein
VYHQATLGNVSPMDSVLVLHRAHIGADIIKWTKEHLVAYLASATVIIHQHDEPADKLALQSILVCLAVCVVDRELYGFDRCSVVLVILTGILKFLFEWLRCWLSALCWRLWRRPALMSADDAS